MCTSKENCQAFTQAFTHGSGKWSDAHAIFDDIEIAKVTLMISLSSKNVCFFCNLHYLDPS